MKGKRFLSLVLVMSILCGLIVALPVTAGAATVDIWDATVATGFGGGKGTADDPYQIYNGSQLAYLAQSVNNGTSYSGKYIKLMNDIVLNDTSNWEEWDKTAPKNEWTAIGTSYDYSFQGTFDGDGHTVSGIYINSTSDYQGLFGRVNNSTIENVGVIDSYISGSGNYVGGVVGYNDAYGTVKNCYNTGSVAGSYRVGGVVGYNWCGTVTNCYNSGSVTGSGNYVGGVVGYNYGNTVENCYNTGSVTGSGNYVGGVVGKNNYGTVTNCYNTGSVSGSEYVGGVVGENYYGTVTNCYNTGSVTGSDYVGGVVGYNDYGTVTNCYNTGSVTGDDYVGGVVGSGGTVTNCYNMGSVTGNDYVGGVVGRNYDTVTNCYNTGSVTGSGNYVGGVVGYNWYGNTVTNCYNTGSVTGSGYEVGGVVGENWSGTVTNCYNTGSVTGSYYVGGVVGDNYDSGTVTNCYYLSGCAKDGSGVVQYGIGNITKGKTTADVSGKTTGLTETEMKSQASFVGFDFDKIWTMAGNPDYPYPELIGMEHVLTPVVSSKYVKNDNIITVYVTTQNIPETAQIYVAAYDESGKLKEIKISALTENSTSAQMSLIGIDKIKVFAWDDNLMPYAKCEWDVE